jgi:hypothetical protein
MANGAPGHALAIVLLALALTSPCVAQPLSAAATPPVTSSGAYERLSPGNRKIVDALYEAQTTTGSAIPLTRDQIAAQKSVKGWNEVFKSMKAQGLLQEKSIGQVISGYAQRHRVSQARDSRAAAPSSRGK